MSFGDQADIARRLKAVLPSKWFPDTSPVLDTILSGFGSPIAGIVDQITYLRAQTRLATATDDILDLAVQDFLTNFPRRQGEPDTAYSVRFRREVVRPRNTRAAIIQVLQDLTGNTPTVFRPSNAADTGGYGGPGVAQGNLNQGTSPWTQTTAQAPPSVGQSVYQHTAPLTGDTNVGAYSVPSVALGATASGVVSVWIPSAYTGTFVTLDLEHGGVTTDRADLTLRDQWQSLNVAQVVTVAGTQPLVLRAQGAGANNIFYSSGWGWSRSSDPAPVGAGLGFDVAGGWGALDLPFQAFVVIERGTAPGAGGVSTSVFGVSGWGSPLGGWGVGAIGYGDGSAAEGAVTDAEIYAAVASVTPAGHINWVQITGLPPAPTFGLWDESTWERDLFGA